MTAGADYKWSGTQLTEINSHSGTLQPTFQYEYDCNGNRLRKTRIPASSLDSRQVTEYLLDGDRILQEYTYLYAGYLYYIPTSAADCITYYYDEAGDVIGLNYYGTDYYYYKNIFGDVLGIMTPSGTMVVRYSYDAWGNILSITGSLANSLGKNNPFRYRSYYYDNETGWYYLKSRYYAPSICRFISPDDRMFAGGTPNGISLYAYCGNNPVNAIKQTSDYAKATSVAKNTFTEARNATVISKKKTFSPAIKIIRTITEDSSPIANHVTKTHITTPTWMLDAGSLIGKIGFSTTTTFQDKDSAFFNSYTDMGNDSTKYGAEINAWNWLGLGGGLALGDLSNSNLYLNAQITPWFHCEASAGLDGIGASVGIQIGKTSYDFELKGGWGLLPFVLTGVYSGSPQTIPAH